MEKILEPHRERMGKTEKYEKWRIWRSECLHPSMQKKKQKEPIRCIFHYDLSIHCHGLSPAHGQTWPNSVAPAGMDKASWCSKPTDRGRSCMQKTPLMEEIKLAASKSFNTKTSQAESEEAASWGFFICLPLIGLCQVEPVSTSTILTNMAELSATIAVIGLLQRLKQRRSCETSPKVTELWPSMKHIVQNWYIGHALVLFKASTRPICRHSSLVKIHLSHPGNI